MGWAELPGGFDPEKWPGIMPREVRENHARSCEAAIGQCLER